MTQYRHGVLLGQTWDHISDGSVAVIEEVLPYGPFGDPKDNVGYSCTFPNGFTARFMGRVHNFKRTHRLRDAGTQ